jgi:crotonobetainyl-CoA:carnitine CoA-transferase CaiB-like acyl-CoA transferase
MLDAGIYFNWPDLMWNYSFEGDDVQYAGDLADMYEVSKTRDGHIVSHHLGADTSSYSTDEIVELLAENGIPVAKANSRADVINDPQVLAMDIIESSQHPRGGRMLLPRTPVRFEGTPTKPHLVSPEVGEHTVEILTELGMTLPEMNALASQGAIG